MTAPPEGFYRWAVREFGPTAYHRPEFYARCVHALAQAHAAQQATPTFTREDAAQLASVRQRRREANGSAERRHLMDTLHALEAKRDADRRARATVFGAQMDLSRALDPAHGIAPPDRYRVDRALYGRILDHDKWQTERIA